MIKWLIRMKSPVNPPALLVLNKSIIDSMTAQIEVLRKVDGKLATEA